MRAVVARAWPWLVVVITVVAGAVVVGAALPDGPALDPRSTSPHGARAVVDVLDELGRRVRVASTPAADDAAVLVLADRLSTGDRARLRDHLDQGATVVVADPTSPLAAAHVVGRLATDVVGPSTFAPRCGDPALADVGAVRSAAWWMLEPGPGDRACFPVGEGAWFLRRPVGAGELVLLGGGDAFSNARLDEADNALLLVRLLGDGPVLVAAASPPGGGEATLAELVPPRVHVALGLLILAFVLAAWASGRRLGLPPEEPLPVRIPASELVVATGELMHRAGLRASAAATLRSDLRRDARTRLGLPDDLPADVLAARIAAWTGSAPAEVAWALHGPDPADDRELLRVARATAAVRARLGTPTERAGATSPAIT